MMQPGKKVSELDKNVIRALQGDFPLVEEPYKELAARAGVSEEVFLARVKEMTEQKMIRKRPLCLGCPAGASRRGGEGDGDLGLCLALLRSERRTGMAVQSLHDDSCA